MEGTLRQSLGRFALVASLVAIGGLLAGWSFAKGQPRAAAGAVVADFVETEASRGNDPAAADAALVAPTSGDHLGAVRCGWSREAISNDDHLATLAAGVVVIRHGPAITDSDLARLEAFSGTRDDLLVAPEPRLEVPLVALSWGRRMALPAANLELLAAFHTASVGIAPDVTDHPCPATGP